MSHKALTFAGPAVPFELTDRPTPKPGPDQVLIKNVAAALNPADYIIQHLGIWVDHFGYPALVGLDGAGEIVAIGEGVQGRNVGDRVLYNSNIHPDTMTFQEYGIADAVQTAKIPPNVSFEQASTLPVGFATAAIGLYQESKPRGGIALTAPWEEGGLNKYAGQTALVTGGASSVGQFAIQLLRLSGFSPIIATASKHNEAYCKAAGATHVIDYHDVPYSDLPAAVKKITSEPISVIYDAVALPDVQKAVWEILAPNGSLASVAPPSFGKDGERNEDGKLVSWVYGSANGPYGSANGPYNYEFGKKMYVAITKLLESGDIKPNNVEIVPNGLAGIPDALTQLALKKVSGVKLVARVAETSGPVGGAGLKDAIPAWYASLRPHFGPPGSLPNPF
ncbi:GroES-like protein [Irpex rosettiformis]|uniref:GroES-like protein n=1 Tax=Irpex rosettiformis TaxID=378272 RepID=A0ACB8UGR0_9APHY|nr:GroES-like protein [Irpex rosettiformis]